MNHTAVYLHFLGQRKQHYQTVNSTVNTVKYYAILQSWGWGKLTVEGGPIQRVFLVTSPSL